MLFAVRDLGIQPAALGGIIAIGGASNFAGAALAPHVLRWMTLGQTLIASTVVSGVVALLIPMAQGPWMGAAMLAAHQLLAAMQMMFKGAWPIGAFTGGLLAVQTGSRFTLTVSALGVFASAGWLWFSPVRRLRSQD